MKNIITIALCLLTMISQAQSQRVDTSKLTVFNTGRTFVLTAADFGGTPTQNLIGEMVRAYDTVMVLKAQVNADSSGKKPMRHEMERRTDKISSNLKDKIAVIELNKDCDVTQTCLNVQRAGAIALVIIHESNDKKLYKLLNKGIYKDSIRIPCYTIPNDRGEYILQMLPSMAGIRVPVIQTQALAANNTALGINTQATPNKTTGAEPINNSSDKAHTNESFNLGKIDPITGKFEEDVTLYPNPTADVLNLTFKGYTGQAVDIVILDMQGKAILTEHLGQLQSNLHSIPIGNKTAVGQYMIRISTKGKKDVFKTFTVGK